MRYIDLKLLSVKGEWPPQEWQERAEKALNELRKLPPGKQRAAFIDSHSSLWSELKGELRNLSHGKCWYCETRIDRDYGDIDHFRPKKAVDGVPDHEGYWWLAFDWRNFRFSCKLCNTQETDREAEEGDGKGGKGAHFPLVDGERYRVCDESGYEEYEDLLDEHPLLLDPTERRDPWLLTFNYNGKPTPGMNKKDTIGYRRAEKSIELYHLDYTRVNRERRRLYERIHLLVKRIQRYQGRWERNHDISARASLKEATDDLCELINERSQYSAAARAYLRRHRRPESDWDWVDELLTR